MASYDPAEVARVQKSQAYSAIGRVGLEIGQLVSWDDGLLREPRVCIPVDVQALVVPAVDPAGTEGVRLAGPLSPGRAAPGIAGSDRLVGVAPFTAPSRREPGVHLHWAMPDSLLRGTLADPTSQQPVAGGPRSDGGGLGLPALPDRWLVVRLLAPAAGGSVVARGWVLDSGTGRIWPLAAWTGDPAAPGFEEAADTAVVPPAGLTGAAGGTLTWTAGYDAAGRRFALHDPLEDLEADPTLGGSLPGGPHGGRASYLVVGWWSQPDLDPLDGVRGTASLERRLSSLGWRLDPATTPSSAYSEPPPTKGEPSMFRAAALGSDTHVYGRAAVEDLGLTVARRHGATAEHMSVAAGLLAEAGTGSRYVQPAKPTRLEASALLHGTVVGVPVVGDLVSLVAAADLRPAPTAAETGLGEHLYDALGAMTTRRAAARLGITDDSQSAAVERLLTAFVQHSLPRLGDPVGAAEIDEDIHAAGFTAVASGEPDLTDRLIDGKVQVPDRGRRIGRAPAAGKGTKVQLATAVTKSAAMKQMIATLQESETIAYASAVDGADAQGTGSPAAPSVRTETRPTPNRYVPSDPYLAMRGVGRSQRHGGDGRWSSDGTLLVRHPSQIAAGYHGVLRGSDVVPSLPSGAVPAEASALAREAVLVSPHLAAWLADRAAERSGAGRAADVSAYRARFDAETLLRFDVSGAYSNRAATSSVSGPSVDAIWRAGDAEPDAVRVVAASRDHSLLEGVEPSPVGVTAWAQPWVPMWVEFTVAVASTGAAASTMSDWTLGPTDLAPAPQAQPATAPVVRTVTSRVPLTAGVATALGGAVARYVLDEARRDIKGVGEVDDAMSARLTVLAAVAGSPDLLGASLDGVRQALLGLPARTVADKAPDGSVRKPVPTGAPHLLTAGAITLTAARVVDAFGRVLDLDPGAAAVPQRLSLPGRPGTIRRPPRFTAPARVHLRLVGAESATPTAAVTARVDEVDPAAMVNPVAGFLLPDHVDESLEVFAADGTPLGELLVTGSGGPEGGGVVWEPAPGRPVPVDAAPSVGLAAAQRCLGDLAAGMVAADARARAGRRLEPTQESALSALLRAVDTTLWTVDPVAGAGSAELASIVGRPIAVVRAVLELDVAPDLDQLDLTPAEREARAADFAALAEVGVTVRLGEITRPDDGLLCWFLDDDHSRARLVDAVVADLARESGPGVGHLAAWGQTDELPAVDPIRHPYLAAEDEVVLRPGVPRMVTLLMAPGAAVHVTSAVVPRTRTALARSWFSAGLDRLVPSIRVGPVLIDPGDVKLPLVAALGERQTLTTREGPTGWRDDAILAATASAVLPDRATVLREGWIRVMPDDPSDPGAAGAAP